ncbi:hypothetical protein [Bartonella sp. F02]|uniref:hypothetical protein n=1 Tax=Bartonella sp. F02 TaxID=2967262 RepID=UPI0022A966DF|nr:hypothetical protein [Bartonella sp. F02]MCZ2328789.1 hypothetical protein [Bartonella sp. F02]
MLLFSRFLFLVCVSVLVGGCTIEPLYRQVSQVPTEMVSVSRGKLAEKDSASLSQKLASIVVEEPTDHFGQMVRNRLLFLMYGNGSEPSVPLYQLSLQTSVLTQTSVQVEESRYMDKDTKRERRPSMGTVISQASYILKDMKNIFVARGKGVMSASFDRPLQEYATLQAEKDAKKRAAEELAEQIFMLLAKDLAKS